MSQVSRHTWENWFSAGGRQSEVVEWRDGMRVADLVPEKFHGARGLTTHLNGVACGLDARVCVEDHVDFAIRPAGPAFLAGSFLSQILIGVGASIAINLILSAILGKPKGPKRRGDEESSHSAWSGPSNVRVEGQPQMVIYGRFRVAGTIIDEFVVTQSGPPKSTLYSLVCFGEGPIAAIGNRSTDNATDTPLSTEDPTNPVPTGIQLEGNAVENFQEIEAHVRMGSSEQEAVPGFELVATDYAVGATLLQAETSGSQQVLNSGLDLVTVLYNSNVAGAQAVWSAYGFSYDMTTDADQFTALVDFPGGLYGVSGAGAITDAGFQLLMRYKELDNLGAPINVGGDNADGFVYLVPEPMMLSREQGPFGREYSGVFRDPQQYVVGGLGRALLLNGTTHYGSTDPTVAGGADDTIPNLPATWSAGQDMAECTFEGWVNLDGLHASAGSDYRPLVEIAVGTNANRGIALMIQRVFWNFGGDSNVPRWMPVLYTGNGSARTIHYEHDGGNQGPPQHFIPTATGYTGYYHVAATYKRVSPGSARLRIYLNSVLAYGATSTLTSFRVQSPGGALELGHARVFQANAFTKGRLDEWRIYQRELTASEIAAAYLGGNGVFGAPTTDLVAGWHFDETPGATTGADFGTFQSLNGLNDLYFKGGATTDLLGSGKVNTGGAGPLKRSRYRVNLLRLNLKSNSSLVQDESVWSILYGKLDEKLAYPLKPLLALKVPANDQLSGSAPLITALVDGRPCPIWDGVSTVAPTITDTWTKNPAWICLDIATNKRYGRGTDFDFSNVDLNSVKEWADYCDELIYDNRGHQQAIHESTGSAPIFDMRYQSSLFGGTGGIDVFFRTSPTIVQPPARWTAGRFIGFRSIPFPSAGLNVNINTGNIPGFEIGNVIFSGGWVIRIKYPTAIYGAPWLDDAFLSTVMTATLSGQAEGRERRFEYSWPHDTFKSAWDTMIAVAETGRAMPMRDGHRLRFRVEKPRAPVGIVTMASIIPGSFEVEYAGTVDRTNSISADYWDEDQNYDRRDASKDDPTLSTTAAEEEIHRESITLEGVTRRSQVLRDIYFRLKVNRLLTKNGRFRTGLEALAYEVGDVVQIAHDIVPWGKSGRIISGSSGVSMILDRSVTLAPATTYFIRVSPPGQQAISGQVTDKYETGQVGNVAGTYGSGATISVTAAFSFVPQKDDRYVLYKLSEVLLAEITEITLTENFERAIEWVKYDAEIYNVDVLDTDITSILGPEEGPPTGGHTIPLAPTTLRAFENVEMGTDGGWTSRIGVAWVHDPETIEAVGSTVVYVRAGSGWTRAAEVQGIATRANFVPPTTARGTELEIAVQPVSFRGHALRPDRCARVSVVLSGVFAGPDPPTALTASMNDEKVEHVWTPPVRTESLTFEARRGGWILGLPVFTSPVGAQLMPPIRNWASTEPNIYGEAAGEIYMRSRDPRGQYSVATKLSGFVPSIEGGTVLLSHNFEDFDFASPLITGGAVAVYAGRTVVEFTGSGTTLVIDTSTMFVPTTGQGERQYVELVVAADQVPPMLVSEMTLPLDSPWAHRRSIEGATSLLDDELASCTIYVEYRWRTTITGTKTEWVPYSPGIIFAVAGTIEWRVTITRSDPAFNVRVYRMGYRTTRVPRQRHERTPQQWSATSRVINHG